MPLNVRSFVERKAEVGRRVPVGQAQHEVCPAREEPFADTNIERANSRCSISPSEIGHSKGESPAENSAARVNCHGIDDAPSGA